MGHITFKGKIFKVLGTNASSTYKKLADALASSIEDYLVTKFNDSIQLAIMLGNRIDQETIRAIVRSVHVDVTSYDPFKFTVEFKDKYSHWYVGQDMPEEVADQLREVMRDGIEEWTKSIIPRDILKKAFS